MYHRNYYTLKTQIGATHKKVYLVDSFWNFSPGNSDIHKHNFPEAHINLSGVSEILFPDCKYLLTPGDICIIPQSMLHKRNILSDNAKITSLMIDAPVEDFSMYSAPLNILSNFFEAISTSSKTENYTTVNRYISFLCGKFYESELSGIEECSDHSLVIEDFLNRNFTKNPKLSDLAEILHFSEKHTSRLISKHTGNTLRGEISERRAEAVNILKSTTDMTNSEIAELLGYSSYSSLWKTLKSRNV